MGRVYTMTRRRPVAFGCERGTQRLGAGNVPSDAVRDVRPSAFLRAAGDCRGEVLSPQERPGDRLFEWVGPVLFVGLA